MMYVGRWFLPALILLLFSAATVHYVITLHRQRMKVMALVNVCRLTPLVWEGWVRAVSSHRLLPGDIVVLRQGKAVCDLVILQGSCLVMESMLSGEVRDPAHSSWRSNGAIGGTARFCKLPCLRTWHGRPSKVLFICHCNYMHMTATSTVKRTGTLASVELVVIMIGWADSVDCDPCFTCA